jgi:hypothetical protein
VQRRCQPASPPLRAAPLLTSGAFRFPGSPPACALDGSVRLTSAADDSIAVKRFVTEGLMLKGFAVAVICIGILVMVDYQVYNGVYTDQALQMLRQIGYSFGY